MESKVKVYQALVLGAVATGLSVGVIAFMLWAGPQYNVYRMKMDGEAKLAESQASRQVLVSEAQAKKEAAVLLGEAELTKAQYQAKAAASISSGLTKEYLTYLWINEQGGNGNSTFVYIPTNNLGIPDFNKLPITEANRIPNKGQVKPQQ
jgi:hypothetical protein